MSVETAVNGLVSGAETVLSNTTTTVLLDNDSQDVIVHSIAYACEGSGDTLTLDTYDGSTARRLRQVAISANADAAYEVPFLLQRTHDLRGTLTSGNTTSIRITYAILND